ncbi:hypothetical protein DST30_11835 [Salmonella enterica subsp. enterica serovar Panama]|nr:hypothetical protein [Salmonella enterica subsp. enterica serovar Panama]
MNLTSHHGQPTTEIKLLITTIVFMQENFIQNKLKLCIDITTRDISFVQIKFNRVIKQRMDIVIAIR